MTIGSSPRYHVYMQDRSRRIKLHARKLGFSRTGITEAAPLPKADYLDRFLASGRAGEMGYLHRNRAIRTDPRNLLPGARSVIVVAMNYHQRLPFVAPESANRDGRAPSAVGTAPDTVNDHRGRVAMYAWGQDYHVTVKGRLKELVTILRTEIAESFRARVCVDTVPINERELAAQAGVGWIGKNTLVLHQEMGSYFFLGAIVTTLELAADQPVTDHCGRCTRCLDACPTGAFPAPYELDASRCISYLTIEHRGDIPAGFHSAMGDWVFGCDVCQQVCPFNRELPDADAFDIRPPGPRPKLNEIANWSEADYEQQTRGSATSRANLHMFKRNAAIASRNVAEPI